jgi:hypothetical protein
MDKIAGTEPKTFDDFLALLDTEGGGRHSARAR